VILTLNLMFVLLALRKMLWGNLMQFYFGDCWYIIVSLLVYFRG